MNSANKTSKVLGIAFLLQFFTSLFSGTILRQKLIIPGNITESMNKIAENAWLMRVNILVDMITSVGIIFLGATLFVTLRRQNEKIALVAMGLYILEAVLLAVSKVSTFLLLCISQEFVNEGHPA